MGGRTPGSDLRDGGTTVSHTAGRALTPRDLSAQRGYVEACAFLSAEAALLAVLVARIGEREQIVIHPGDLIEEVRERLDWRDVPAALHPKRIGAWLRRLGFSPVGRDRLGVKYEIQWDRLWQLDPRAVSAPGEGLDLFALEGSALVAARAGAEAILCPEDLVPNVSRRRRDPVGRPGRETRGSVALPEMREHHTLSRRHVVIVGFRSDPHRDSERPEPAPPSQSGMGGST